MLMIIWFVLLVIGAYLLGSVPSAYLAAKWSRGIDIRRYGSGNVGATNLLNITSKWLAILVIIFDLGKGAVMVWVAQLLGLGVAQQVIVGVAAIVGHNWPVYLGFNGGRGVLTLVGVALILAPVPALILLVVAFLFAPFHQLALGTLIVIAAISPFAWFLAQPFGIEEPASLSLGFLAIFLVTVLRRLTAPRTSATDSVSSGELLVNRLFFDRDIRSREAWINRTPPEVESSGPSLKQQGKQAKS